MNDETYKTITLLMELEEFNKEYLKCRAKPYKILDGVDE